jgi:uncharacterized Fe-S cluster protein YjdI/CDGSH-type Zn-finger protein
MPRRLQTYAAPDVTVTFDPTRCIHAAECIRALPDVFDSTRARWIRPERATATEVVDAVMRCPTGALHYALPGGPAEAAAEGPTVIQLSRNGALYARGEVRVVTEDDHEVASGPRLALCRCGASRNQPFCDGSHRTVAFRDS